MSKKLIIAFSAIIIIALVFVFIQKPKQQASNVLPTGNMRITSPAFADNQTIPKQYTCDGQNINPALNIVGVPTGAQSLVLIMNDPDSPSGVWQHWLIWNIDPKVSQIAENSVPANSVEGVTSFNKVGYGGPCPGSGTHHYVFKLYALDVKLDLPGGANIEQLAAAMNNHILDQAQLIGLYNRH